MVRVPTPDEEDAKRPHPGREHLVQKKLRIENPRARCATSQAARSPHGSASQSAPCKTHEADRHRLDQAMNKRLAADKHAIMTLDQAGGRYSCFHENVNQHAAKEN